MESEDFLYSIYTTNKIEVVCSAKENMLRNENLEETEKSVVEYNQRFSDKTRQL